MKFGKERMMNIRSTDAIAVTDGSLVSEPAGERDTVLDFMYASIAEINAQLSPERRIEPSLNTALFGEGGSLDSLALANFIIIMEQKLEHHFGYRIDLTEDDPFSPANGHFKTVCSLATYISSLIRR